MPESAPDQPGFAQFRQRVQDDPELQRRLRGIDDKAAFFEAAAALGAQCGFRFSAREVAAAAQAGQLAWLTYWLPVV